MSNEFFAQIGPLCWALVHEQGPSATWLDTLANAPVRSTLVFADVAELVDAQVSEACGGDTVVVRFHSSA
jgi:hypothetical protein